MSSSIDELSRLPLSQRLELVEKLWDSIAADIEQLPLTSKQADELDRRLAAHEATPEDGSRWEDVRQRLRGK